MNVSYVGFSSLAGAATASVSAEPLAASQRQVAQAARVVNQSGELGRNQIVFSIDTQTRQRVVLIENKETHDVVQQIPPEYVLKLAQNLRDPSLETNAEQADT